jgi:hypothetical protein
VAKSPRKPNAAARVQKVIDALNSAYDVEGEWGRNKTLNIQMVSRARHLGLALFEDLFGPQHRLTVEFEASLSSDNTWVEKATGIAEAAQAMVTGDWLTKSRTLISGEVFTDFLDMAEHLHTEGYKDAAAVIAGSALEAHLKRLADTTPAVGSTFVDKGEARPKNPDRLNTDLYKAGVYGLTDQKHIQAWQAIRHDAAHGRYERVVKEQVQGMIVGVRFFIRTFPA